MTTTPQSATDLKSRITSHDALVGIIGLGYVGLPLALALAEERFHVLGFDVDPAKIDAIAAKECYIKHLDAGRLAAAVDSGRLAATTDFDRLSEPDAILICVPTPLTVQREPDMRYVEATAHETAKRLRPGQLVVLESTTYPGTTEELVRSILESPQPQQDEKRPPQGLTCGSDFFLAFSPEREDPGNPSYGTTNTPKVVGGVDEVSGDLAQLLYDQIISKTVRVSSARAAEAAKLTENIFRAVNIALVNELKIVYDAMGIDVWEVLDAAATKPFGFMRFNPGPGWGGHCIAGNEWLRVRGAGCYGVYRAEELFKRLGNQYPAVVTPGGIYVDPDGLEALALDPATGEVDWFPVKTFYRGRFEGNAVTISTQDSRQLTVTDEHPMLVWNGGSFGVRAAHALRPGQRIPILRDGEDEDLRSASLLKDGESALTRVSDDVATVAVAQVSSNPFNGWVYSMEVEQASTFTTSSGIGVHNCIPLDPFYLAWKAREYGTPTRFIELAGEVNVHMPEYVVSKLSLGLNAQRKAVNGAKVLILGLAYKKDIDDPRESPAFEIIDQLLELGADLSYHDPHIPTAPAMRTWPDLPPMRSVDLTPDTLRAADAVLIVTDHSAVDYDLVAEHAPLIVDTRGIYRDHKPNITRA